MDFLKAEVERRKKERDALLGADFTHTTSKYLASGRHTTLY